MIIFLEKGPSLFESWFSEMEYSIWWTGLIHPSYRRKQPKDLELSEMFGPGTQRVTSLNDRLFFMTFFKLTFSFFFQEHYHGVSNCLDPDQDRQNVGPDLGPNCLQWSYQQTSTVDASKEKVKPFLHQLILPASLMQWNLNGPLGNFRGHRLVIRQTEGFLHI